MTDSLRDQLLGLGFKPAPRPERTDKPARPRHDGARGAPAGAAGRPQSPGRPGPHGKPAHDRPAQARPEGGDRRGGRPDAGRPHAGQAHAGKPNAGAPGGTRPGGARPGGRPAGGGKPRTREEIDLAKAYAIRAQREKEERIEAERVKQEDARKRREAKAALAEFVKDKGLNDAAAEIARHFEYGGKIKRIYVNEAQLKALNAGELGVVQLDGRYLLVTAQTLAQAEALFPAGVALKVDPDAPASDDPYADPQYKVPDDLVW